MNILNGVAGLAYNAVAMPLAFVGNGIANTSVLAAGAVLQNASNAAKYALGVNNLGSAFNRLTEPVSYRIIQTPGKAELEAYMPSIVDRVRNASSEMCVFTGKFSMNAVYATGGVAAGLQALGVMREPSAYSPLGMAQGMFNATNTVVGNGLYYAANATYLGVTEVVFPVINNIVIPTLTNIVGPALLNAGKLAVANPVNATFTASIGTFGYMGYSDLSKALAPNPVVVHVRGASIGYKEGAPIPLRDRFVNGATGLLELAAATALLMGAIKYNSTPEAIPGTTYYDL